MSSMKPTDAFEQIISKPVTRKPVQRDAEVTSEDEQVFLMKQQSQLTKQPQAGPQVAPESTTQRIPRTPAQRMPERPGGKAGDVKVSPGGGSSEGMLANFFNSLLNKKTGAPATPGAAPDKVTRDAAAELERMTRKKGAADASSNDSSATGS